MTKAKLVVSYKRGRGRQSSPLLLSMVMSLVAVLDFGLEFSEPAGVRASCVHTTCAGSWVVQGNSVFSMYFLRVSSF